MGNVVACDLIVRKFKFPSYQCVHFRTNMLGNDENTFIIPAVLLQWLWYEIPHQGWYAIKQRNPMKAIINTC